MVRRGYSACSWATAFTWVIAKLFVVSDACRLINPNFCDKSGGQCHNTDADQLNCNLAFAKPPYFREAKIPLLGEG